MRLFFYTLFMVLSLSMVAQNNPNTGWIESLSFDNQWDTFHIKLNIDTTSGDNVWQIGPPQKTVLNQANSLPNVIITDTTNSYPINDTSVFMVTYLTYNCPWIEGSYYVDTDSLNDYGMIEFSMDIGQTWINVLSDSTIYQLGETPILTGRSNGWKYINLDFANYSTTLLDDTLLVKFTFISDSIDTGHDGLMFDNLNFCIVINTEDLQRLNTLKVFPNPTNQMLNFELEEPLEDAEIRIFSSIGQLQERKSMKNQDLIQFEVANWQRGVYYYGIFVEGKLMKQGQVLIMD